MRYKAWGETRYSYGTAPSTYKYTGQREEASFGLYYYGARWYDTALGRFVQADTIVPDGVQGLDRYAYVNNNPVRYNDPSGHTYCDFGKCHKVEPPLKQAVSSLWDNDDYESVGNPKAAEKAFYHFLVDPGYFANLYTDPQAWTTSEEVANLDVFLQYSNFHTTADSAILSLLNSDTAANLEAAYLFNGIGDTDTSDIFLVAGALSLPFSDTKLSIQILKSVIYWDATGLVQPGIMQGGSRNSMGVWTQGLYQGGGLPKQPLGYYTELDVWYSTGPRNPSPQRLVFGSNGEVYFTLNH